MGCVGTEPREDSPAFGYLGHSLLQRERGCKALSSHENIRNPLAIMKRTMILAKNMISDDLLFSESRSLKNVLNDVLTLLE